MTEVRTKNADQKFCSECGEIINVKAEICPKCGVRQLPAPIQIIRSRKERSVAGVLALFLGGVGGQDFYLGNYGSAIVALLFCWTFIPEIWGFFVGLRFLIFMTDSEFDAKYNHVPTAPSTGTSQDVDWG